MKLVHKFAAALLVILQFGCPIHAQTWLRADGVTDSYTLIQAAYGTGVEMPDVNHHAEFGPHVTQTEDTELGRHVFAFHSHIREDHDLWGPTDRLRTEIATKPKGLDHSVIGFQGDRLTLSWNFKLDGGFLPPYSFCHIFQLKVRNSGENTDGFYLNFAQVSGGDDSMPVLTLTTRRSTPNELQLLQYDSKGDLNFLETNPLAPFLGQWIHAYADFTVGFSGSIIFQLTNLASGEAMFNYANNNIDFWRNGTVTYMMAKWGLYRSKQEVALSRDEIVLFDNFCVAKGNLDRCN